MSTIKLLSDRNFEFKTGYLIVGNTLFQLENKALYDYWELESTGNIEDKVTEARKIANISKSTPIYYDDEGVFTEDAIICESGLYQP